MIAAAAGPSESSLSLGPCSTPLPAHSDAASQNPQVVAQLVCTQLKTAVSFVEPIGCAASHAAAHVESEHAS